ncbi:MULTISPECIES: hypothetical protein [unclassified Streptomyces]|uniref:hypothetical protein n=1 Tax=unclassified Streptomyces TaxID=2593676 RepID=UPI0027410609|nr:MULTISPECIES: hypothetical protein [unclassified Streptomyces]
MSADSSDVKRARTPTDDEVLDFWHRQQLLKADRQLVFAVLKWRGIPVTNLVRSRVNLCGSRERLELWMRRAVHAKDAAEVFAEK